MASAVPPMIVARYGAALALGFALAYAMIPPIIRFATKFDVLDFPSEDRRIHRKAVPRLGGVAVFLSILLTIAVLRAFEIDGEASAVPQEFLPLAVALAIVFVVGLVDDIRGVRARTKLVAQTVAAVVVVVSGFVPATLGFATGFGSIPLWYLAIPLTVLWIVGVTNAFNLIDGMDGLAGTAALIGFAVCVWLDAFYPASQSPELVLASAGAIVAFLAFNRHPARIFLGDSGSMVLGFLLAVRLISSATDHQGRTYVLVPLFTLALPLLDTGIAIARRWLRGDPFSRADGRHVHHQILALGVSPRLTLELLGFFFTAIAILGVSISFAPTRFTMALVGMAVIILFGTFWYGMRWLRYHEFSALGGSLTSIFRNARLALQEKIRADEAAQRVGKAETLTEVLEIVSGLVGETRLLDVEIFEPSTDIHSHGPSRQRISAYDALPIRFDYPFTRHEGDAVREMVLRIWCPRPSLSSPTHTAERVASRVGPALEAWFNERSKVTAEVETVTARPRGDRTAAARSTAERAQPASEAGTRTPWTGKGARHE